MKLSKHAKFYKLGINEVVVYNNLIFEPIILTNEEKNNLKSGCLDNFNDDEIKVLKEKGILINTFKQDSEVEDKLLHYYNQDNAVSLAYIIPTNYCNLKCKYCFIGKLEDKDKIFIDDLTIKNTIDKLAEENKDFALEKTTIIFYGGEPLVALNQIVKICDYCQKNYPDKFEFAIVTNATLLTENAISVFEKYHITVGISIDCPRKTNDKNRIFKNNNNSVYDIVVKNIDRLKTSYVNFGLSITISKDVLNDKQFFPWLKSLGVKDVSYNLLHFNTIDPEFEDYYKKASKFLLKSNEVLKNTGIIEDRLNRKINAFHSKSMKFNDCAAVGGQQICVDPNGNVTVCHGFWHTQEDRCGNINLDSLQEIKDHPNFIKWKQRTTINNKKCINCPAIYICGGGCYLQSERQYNQSDRLDKGFCIHTKATLKWLLKNQLTNTQK